MECTGHAAEIHKVMKTRGHDFMFVLFDGVEFRWELKDALEHGFVLTDGGTI